MKALLNSLSILLIGVVLTACGGKMTLTNVNFATPFEKVMSINENGQVADQRSGLTFNVVQMLTKENISLQDAIGSNVHVIRNQQGFYFVTATGFKYVYVMESAESSLKTVNTIKISDAGLQSPAFNQRNQYIQLIDSGRAFNLTRNGIQ